MISIDLFMVLFYRHRIDPVGMLIEGRIIPEKSIPQAVSIASG